MTRVSRDCRLLMQLVPLFKPIESLCLHLWRVLGSHEDVAKHAVRLIVAGFWHDLITDALSNRWEIVELAEIDNRRSLILRNLVGRDFYMALEGQECDWLAVQYRDETLYINSLFYDTRGQVLRTTLKKAVKHGKQVALSEVAISVYTACILVSAYVSLNLIPCDTQSPFLICYRILIESIMNVFLIIFRIMFFTSPIRMNYTCS